MSTPVNTPELGLIEGFYGRPWTWAERAETVAFLGPRGYGFYLYAPKADPYLRRRWREPHPADTATALAGLADRVRAAGVRFGVGLSPFEAWLDFGDAAKRRAHRQARVPRRHRRRGPRHPLRRHARRPARPRGAPGSRSSSWCAAARAPSRIIVCPSLLLRRSGSRPRLRPAARPSISSDWARCSIPRSRSSGRARKSCSRELSVGHLRDVTRCSAEAVPVGQLSGERRPAHVAVPAPARIHGGAAPRSGSTSPRTASTPRSSRRSARIPALTLVDVYRARRRLRVRRRVPRARRAR